METWILSFSRVENFSYNETKIRKGDYTMNAVIQYFKNDFARVTSAMQFVSNGKMPMWLCAVVYILLLPLGLMLMPFALLWMWYVKRQIDKLDK